MTEMFKSIHHVNSFTAIKSLNSLSLMNYLHLELIWVPEHQGVESNQNLDKCSVSRSSLDKITSYKVVVLLAVGSNNINDQVLIEITTRCYTIHTCRISIKLLLGIIKGILCLDVYTELYVILNMISVAESIPHLLSITTITLDKGAYQSLPSLNSPRQESNSY